MAGSKGVLTRGGSTRGKGRGVLIRKPSNGGRGDGRSSSGGSNGTRGGGGEELVPAPNRKKQKGSLDARGNPNGGKNPSHRSTSSIDSNPHGGKDMSPPSQGTHNSNVSRTNSQTQVIPLQYPTASNRPTNSQQRPSMNLNLQPERFQVQIPNLIDEDEPEYGGEEEAYEEHDDNDDEELPDAGGDDLEALVNGNGEGEDYEQMLDNILAHPGRQALPYLSPKPIPQRKSLWFTRDRGLLTREISDIFRRKFDGPWYSWTVTPIAKQERYFRSFASAYNWDLGITELVRSHFTRIATNRMRGIVSQVRNRKPRKRPNWIGEKLWARMCSYWATAAAQERSLIASTSRNSDRNGRGPHKHRGGQHSYLTIQQDMEEELGRPVSWAEVFLKTHTNPDGSFIDLKAKEVAEAYEISLQQALQPLEEADGDLPEASDNTSQRNLSIEEKNNIFLKCTEFDPKGTPFGVGQLSQESLRKGKRKITYEETDVPTLVEVQEELKKANQRIAEQDAENSKRDAALKASQNRISELEKKVTEFLKNKEPEPVSNASPTIETTAEATAPPALGNTLS